MQTKIIKLQEVTALEEAAAVLNNGGLVVFPTDTVYGLAAKVTDSVAIERIYDVKGREHTKAIAVLIGDQSQLNEVSDQISNQTHNLLKNFWPGALTAVVKKQPELPKSLSPNLTIGVRMPDFEFARTLIKKVGPLATTSANLSGFEAAINAEMAYKQLNGKIDLIIDGGFCSGGVASTVIDCTDESFHILREGAIKEEQIRAVLRHNT
ncbi:MAG: threonylcarbamoyl-AMP synthase [Anaerolineaceae bacterium]|nr:threonylcarbamoyl-AMP synthase [Anaerolineaceae bacterium]